MALPTPVTAPADLEALIEQFELAWQSGPPPTLDAYLAGPTADRPHLLRELVHTDLEYRLRAGHAVRVEEYLQRFPELRDDPDEILELLAAEDRHRRQRGEQPDTAEYLERFPLYREHLLQTPLGGAATAIHAPLDHARHRTVPVPKALGRYRVDRVLGRGGMGEVVRVLDDQFDRPLAMKVLRLEYAGDADLVERFLREARLTGQLQHPGIPPVQERGQLDDGRPYFIMKLVKGRDLEELLDERPSPADRQTHYLGVFEQICRTVAYAHASGVLHRDLKPANVMVGAFGEVQVMDWGLAKVLADPAPSDQAMPRQGGSSTVHHLRTPGMQGGASVAGTILGTPAYMAPEQARGEVEKLDAGCDVFGLGGILAEILTGQPPFATGSEMEKLIASMKGDLSAAFARLDGCGADADLVALAKRCLAPERADRPADADAVAQAVTAYQDRVRERLRQAEVARARAEVKAAEERKRRRLHRALAASVLVLLGAAGAGGWWALEQRAEQERQDLLRGEEKKREDERARLAVEAAIKQAKELRSRALFAQARKTLTQAQQMLGPQGSQALHGQIQAALDHLTFVERLDRIRQDKSRIVEGKLNDAGTLPAYAAAFKEQGLDVVHGEEGALVKWVVDSPVREEVLAALDDWLCLEPEPQVKSRLCKLTAQITGHAWREELPAKWDDRKSLEDLLTTVPPQEMTVALLVGLGSRIRVLGGDGVVFLEAARLRNPADFWVWFVLGSVHYINGEQYAKKAADAFSGSLGIRPESVVSWNNLGAVLDASGDFPGAIAAYKEAIRLDPKFTEAHYNLGLALRASGDLPAAIVAYKEAIRLDPKVARAHNSLGVALWASGDLPAAIVAYKEAIRLDPKNATAHFNLGLALNSGGDLPGAIAAYKDAVHLDPKFAAAHYNLGLALRGNSDLPGAIAAYKEAIRLDPKLAQAHNSLGVALQNSGDLPGAIAALKEAIRLDPKYTDAHYNLGLALRGYGDLPGAIAAYKEAIRLDPKFVKAHNNLGIALRASGDLPGAIAAYKEAIRLDPKLAETHANLGLAFAQQKAYGESFKSFQTAFAVDKNFGSHPASGIRAKTAYFVLGMAVADDGKLSPEEKTALRQQALEWLQADLTAWTKLLADVKWAGPARKALKTMQTAKDLASVRGEQALAQLPQAERPAWRQFWSDVDALLQEAEKVLGGKL